jgi:hypothetical protein
LDIDVGHHADIDGEEVTPEVFMGPMQNSYGFDPFSMNA